MMVHGAAKFTTGGACRSVKEFEILETIGEGTYGTHAHLQRRRSSHEQLPLVF